MAGVGLARSQCELFDVANLVGVTRIKGQQRIAQHGLVLFAELTADDADELIFIQIENGNDQAEHEQVLAAILRGATDGLHGGRGERNADVEDALLMLDLLHLAAVVEADAALTQRGKMAVVAVLIEGHEHVRLIASGEHFARAEMHLEDGWPAADRGRDRHVGHHFLRRAARQTSEEAADGLDAILRISGEADDGVAKGLLGIRRRRSGGCGCGH